MEQKITVRIRLEGYPPYEGLKIQLKKDAVIQDLLEVLINNSDDNKYYFINSQTGELQIFGAIINDVFYQLETNKNKTLNEGDQVLFLSPVGGG